MKKILLILCIILFSINSASVQAADFMGVKKFFNKKQVETSRQPAKNSDELTKSQQATLAYSENNLKNAFDIILSIKEDERVAQDWLLLGNILQEQGKNADAVFMYQRSIIVNPKYYKPYYNLANIYLEEEKPNLAIANYKLAIKNNSDFAYAYYNLGCAYLKTGNIKKAKIVFLRAVELKNTVPDFHYNLAYTYKKLGKTKQAKEYLDNYNKLILENH